MNGPGFAKARDFVLANARLLDRHRFGFFFEQGSAAAVRRALHAYRHGSGLFGHALEVDKRTSAPQPVDQAVAMEILDEIGAERAAFAAICEALPGLTAPEGGLPFSHPSVADAPHAPWWSCDALEPASINPTGKILQLLWKNRVTHPWMAPAEAFCWRALDSLSPAHPHALDNAVAFCSAAPDSARADAAMQRLRGLVRAATTFDPAATGYVFSPLTFAPHRAAPAASFFEPAELRADLSKLVAAQQDDGGWPINWPAISPGVEAEARGIVTLRNLRTLADFGMLPDAATRA